MSELNRDGVRGIEKLLELPHEIEYEVDIFPAPDGEGIEGRLALPTTPRRGFSFALPGEGDDDAARVRGCSEESGGPRWLTEERAREAGAEACRAENCPAWGGDPCPHARIVGVTYSSEQEQAQDAGYYDELIESVDVSFPSISWGAQEERKSEIEERGAEIYRAAHPD